jgi:MFS family permease
MLAKLTPLKKRGKLTGIRNSIAGILSFMCGVLLTWLLATQRFPVSYGLAFLCAATLQLASIVIQGRLVEEHPSAAVPRLPLGVYLGRLPRVLRENREFRAFIGASLLLILASMPLGFFTIYALDRFHADESAVGEFTLSIVAAQVVSALANGFVADRFGNKVVLICAAVAMLCASVAALLAPSPGWFMVVFLFVGVNLGSELMARYNIAIEYGPAEQRSTYIGLMNTALAPFYLAGLLGGAISNWFGYHALFVIGIVFSLGGIWLLIARVQDPRVKMQ